MTEIGALEQGQVVGVAANTGGGSVHLAKERGMAVEERSWGCRVAARSAHCAPVSGVGVLESGDANGRVTALPTAREPLLVAGVGRGP